jgi:tyrosine-protein phosphatase SIW14
MVLCWKIGLRTILAQAYDIRKKRSKEGLMFKTVSLLVTLLCVAKPAFAVLDDLPKFATVEPGIYRSGRPMEEGYDRLKVQYGVRTVINLEDKMSAVQKEKQWADHQGIKYYSFPTNSWATPDDSKVEEILALLDDPNLQPILIHCEHGEDRTGLMVGLHRVFAQGWTAKQAHKEMVARGFHTLLFSLDRYFKNKTNGHRAFDEQITVAQ